MPNATIGWKPHAPSVHFAANRRGPRVSAQILVCHNDKPCQFGYDSNSTVRFTVGQYNWRLPMRDLSLEPLAVCLEELIQGSTEERWSALIALVLSDDGLRVRFLADVLAIEVPVGGRSTITFEPSNWHSKRGAPDLGLEVYDVHGIPVHSVFLENKLGAKRTKHQPSGYLDELEQRRQANGSGGDVVFLVPDGRVNSIRRELQKEFDNRLADDGRLADGSSRVLVLSHEHLSEFIAARVTPETSERGRAAATTYRLMSGLLHRDFRDGPEVVSRRDRLAAETDRAEAVLAGCSTVLKQSGHAVKKTKSQGKIVYAGIRVENIDVVRCADAGLAWGQGALWIQRKGTVNTVQPLWPCYEALGFSRGSGIAGWSGVMIPVDLTLGRTVEEIVAWVVGVVESTIAEGSRA